MHTPTKRQLQKVIDLMYTILPLTFETKKSLNMTEDRVDCDHVCGTVHCFAGWFAVACMNKGILKRSVSFGDGATKMAQMLGFEQIYNLKYFADTNRAIWGNNYGWDMFVDKSAFYHPERRPKGAKSVSDIINHLEEVQARLPK